MNEQKLLTRGWENETGMRLRLGGVRGRDGERTHFGIGLSSVLRPRQHSIGYMGDGFYRSKDPTNSIKVLKEHTVHKQIKLTISRQINKKHSKSPSLH